MRALSSPWDRRSAASIAQADRSTDRAGHQGRGQDRGGDDQDEDAGRDQRQVQRRPRRVRPGVVGEIDDASVNGTRT